MKNFNKLFDHTILKPPTTEEELKNAHPFKIVNSAEEILDFFA